MILYCPSPSVTTVRVFSIRAGLEASTVTPGITPPLASRTTPAIACANAAVWPIAKHAIASTPSLAILLIGLLLVGTRNDLLVSRTARPLAGAASHRTGGCRR